MKNDNVSQNKSFSVNKPKIKTDILNKKKVYDK